MHRGRVCNSLRPENRNQNRKIRILLVDDHPSVLRGLNAYLRSRSNLRIVGQSVDGADAIRKAISLRPDIVIMDLSLPRMTGTEAMRRIRCVVPESKLIVYTMHEGKEFVRAALAAGAVGYVLKSSSLKILARATKKVYDEKSFFDRSIASILLSGNGHDKNVDGGQGRSDSTLGMNRNLTKRESQILRMLAVGETIKQIAVSLSVSRNTVSNHVRHVYEKLGVNTRGAVVAKAIRENLA